MRHTFEILFISDFAGAGWTITQQRVKGGVGFDKSWATYRNGLSDFWDNAFLLKKGDNIYVKCMQHQQRLMY